ncbi:hypothetical protein [Stenotrophomonas sp.]|uniref:hypothetical protein n=1 Tax=Stenotrophomonas sp. TaxID=69392 RepID=UPI00289882D6|nr:hypothetical protein [Stenotrophomonas sp.]
MSVIKLPLNICEAVKCKAFNKRVSDETLGKLDTIALGLYQIGNISGWQDACRQLGMNAPGVRSNNLYRGFIDVVNAKAIVAGMARSRAKSQLAEKLCDIQRLIEERVKEFMNLIVLREEVCPHPEAYKRELEEATTRLGVKWAAEAEQKRWAMLAARAKDLQRGGQPHSLTPSQRYQFLQGPSDFYSRSHRQQVSAMQPD